MNRVVYIILFIYAFSLKVSSQSGMLYENNNSQHIIDRFEIKSGIEPKFHSSIKSYNIDDITSYMIKLRDSLEYINDRNLNDIDFILKENIDWLKTKLSAVKYKELLSSLDVDDKGIFKSFYKTPSSLFTVHRKNFFIKVDPVINFNFGKDISNDLYAFQNTRGFKVSGLLDEKIYFYSSLYETQQSFLTHINNRIHRDKAIPGQGFFKEYHSSVLNGANGYDFLNAQAYIGFKITKSLGLQLGHGKFFIGNGIRSLLLSDYSHNYYYLKFDTRVWKFHYQNIFAEMSGTSSAQIGNDNLLPKKYMAMHYLSFRPIRNLDIGLFETIIFRRNNQFEFQYLNPLIIYRTVEQFLGSSDNVLIGLNMNYNLFKKFSIYGQLLLDEFKFSEIKNDGSWWANKYGYQLGVKYIDALGISHFDLQIESNVVRPYTYAHQDSTLSYSHYNQPLAHPLGANFNEIIFSLRYSPFKKVFINSKLLITKTGEDADEKSQGGNILKSSANRPLNEDGSIKEYGFYVANGLEKDILQFSFNTSYMIFHNGFIDFNITYRKENYENPAMNLKEFYFGGGLRINFLNKEIDY